MELGVPCPWRVVLGEQVLSGGDDQRLAAPTIRGSPPPRGRVGQLGEDLHAVVRPCLFAMFFSRRLDLLAVDGLRRGRRLHVRIEIEMLEPHGRGRPYLRRLSYRLAVGARGLGGRPNWYTIGVAEPVVAPGDLQAATSRFRVRLPGSRQGLVEVVDVEDQVALRGAEGSEVRQVGVAAYLSR